MAKGKPIKYDDIIDPGLIEKLKKELDDLRKKFNGIGGDSGEDIKKTNEAIKDTVDITEDLLRLQKIDIRLKKEAQVLRDKQKKYGQLSTKDAARLTKLTEARKQNNRELNNEARLTQQVSGSMNQLSQALAKNKIEYRKLTEEERKNNKVGGQLLKTIRKQDAEIKKLDKTIGDNQRSVGDYAAAVGGLGGQFGIVGAAMHQMKAGFNVLKMGFRSLKAAIASTGIGLLVIAIASLVSWFKKSVAGGEAFTRILAPLKAIVQVVTNIIVSLGEAIWALLNLDFEGFVDGVNEAFTDLEGKMNTAIDQFSQLAELTILNKKQVGDWAIKQAQLNKELQEARLFARDEAQSLEDRIAAIKRTMAIEDELAIGRADLIKQQIAMIVLNEQAGKSNQDEINQRKLLTAELIQIEADQAQRKVRLITYGTTLQNQLNTKESKELKQINQIFVKGFEEREETIEEFFAREEELVGKSLDYFIKSEEEKRRAAEYTAEVEKIARYAAVDIAADAFGVVSELAEKGSTEYKILKTAETVIATYSAAQKSYDSLASIPYVGPALGAAAAAVAVAAGLVNIAKINEVQFAEGTEYVEGGTPGKDSVRAMLMPGERVVPTEINQQLGGIPNEALPGLLNIPSQAKSARELKVLGQIAFNTERSNRYLKSGLKWTDKHGNIYDVEGNKTTYLN